MSKVYGTSQTTKPITEDFMLNNSQTDQTRAGADANFQRVGNGHHARAASAAMPRREPEQATGSRARKASAVAASGSQAAVAHSTAPSHDEIAARAYQVYVRKGRPEGRDTENWLEAEAELNRERGSKAAKR
jgi:hypothetical protein